ncbi:MAG TPA: PfkB family carbohydrate kinase [Candidatus Thermoplasmatota archaeon]|nr:PfkB family carbohydrate kinase [Candidatus Thermoplasmatota archaeon]
MTQVLIVGSVGIDTIETPFGRAENVLGGSLVYAAASASLLAPVRVVGVAGDDLAPSETEFLAKRGVDLAGLEIVPGGRTFRWSGRYHYDLNSRDTLATHLNVLADFDPKVPLPFRTTPFVFLANVDPALQASVLRQVERPRFTVLDTMNFWIEGRRADLERVLTHVDAFIVNDAEARQLTGQANLVKAARAVQKLGPETVVIKKGEHGALLFHRDQVFSAPAYPLEEVYDPTGAGDAFAGGFIGHLARVNRAEPEDLRRAVIVGSALASFAVEEFGVGRLARVATKDLEARIRAFADLSRFA